MVAFLKRSACRTVLVEKTDRLYRNIKDWVTLDELDLEVHLVKENVILSRDSRSHEKLVHGFKVLMAKNYVDNLSEEVKKGMTEKAEQGHWPSLAPIGYRNNPETHRIEPDPDEAPLVRLLFEEAAKGKPLHAVSGLAYAKGLRSRRSKSRITREGIRRILRNPLYWGPFEWNGKVYQGKHEPLITKDLFDEANMIRRSKSKPRQNKHVFAFAGMVTCRCGKRLVGSLARGRYRYYGCSARCGVPSLTEKDLSAQFLEHLKALHIDEKVAETILKAIKESDTMRAAESRERNQRLEEKRKNLQATIDKAYDDKLNGRITEEYWLTRHNAWQEELAVLKIQIDEVDAANEDCFETAEQILKLCKNAPGLYVKQTFEEQARLLRVTHSNSSWDGVTLTPTYNKPFDILAEGLKSTSGGADVTFTQTLKRLLRRLVGFKSLPDIRFGQLAA